jgi:plasmid stabilization system protein ParE
MIEKKIRWSKRATIQINKAYDYIEQDSPLNAQKMYERLAAKLIAIGKDPLINPPDKYKTMNDGSYRVFTLSRYRIRVAYKVGKKEIVILRVRHTSMMPKYY